MLLRILKGVALTTAVAAVSVVALGAAVAARRGERAGRDTRVLTRLEVGWFQKYKVGKAHTADYKSKWNVLAA